jgi:hypothetical protein
MVKKIKILTQLKKFQNQNCVLQNFETEIAQLTKSVTKIAELKIGELKSHN